MSQFKFTPEEDLLVLGAVRAKAAQYLSSMGVNDPSLDALMAKIEEQFTPVSAPEVITEEPAAVAAFMDEVSHEQFTHEEDKAEE
jgi:hypothetical protein